MPVHPNEGRGSKHVKSRTYTIAGKTHQRGPDPKHRKVIEKNGSDLKKVLPSRHGVHGQNRELWQRSAFRFPIGAPAESQGRIARF
jgi:hypothetical protein